LILAKGVDELEVPSTEVQNNFGTYLKLAQVEDVFITRNGKRIAVLKFCEDGQQEFPNVAESRAVYRFHSPKISVEEFQKLTASGENRYELIDGEIYQLASPSYEHQRIVIEMLNAIYQWSQGKKCRPMVAPFDVTLLKDDSRNIVQPDILVICDPEKIDTQGKYNGIPTLIVEVLSEATRSKDMLKKLNLYMDRDRELVYQSYSFREVAPNR
jgi:Uma2 family endonuclease